MGINSIRIQEWHMTPENRKIMGELVRAAVSPDVLFVSHHIVWQKGTEEVELSSPESFLFNHDIAKLLYGEEEYEHVLSLLALIPDVDRLQWLNEHKSFWNDNG